MGPCSPAKIQWEVAPEVKALDRSALAGWCGDNAWGEDHPHGSREVVTREDHLSPLTP